MAVRGREGVLSYARGQTLCISVFVFLSLCLYVSLSQNGEVFSQSNEL